MENIYIKQIVYFPNNICIKKSVAFINLKLEWIQPTYLNYEFNELDFVIGVLFGVNNSYFVFNSIKLGFYPQSLRMSMQCSYLVVDTQYRSLGGAYWTLWFTEALLARIESGICTLNKMFFTYWSWPRHLTHCVLLGLIKGLTWAQLSTTTLQSDLIPHISLCNYIIFDFFLLTEQTISSYKSIWWWLWTNHGKSICYDKLSNFLLEQLYIYFNLKSK